MIGGSPGQLPNSGVFEFSLIHGAQDLVLIAPAVHNAHYVYLPCFVVRLIIYDMIIDYQTTDAFVKYIVILHRCAHMRKITKMLYVIENVKA